MRWPLRFQILVPFAFVLLIAIAAVSAQNAIWAARGAHRQIEEQLQGIAATLVDSTFPLTDVVLRQMRGLSGAEFIFTDQPGRAIAASSRLELSAENPTVIDNWRQLHLGSPIEVD